MAAVKFGGRIELMPDPANLGEALARVEKHYERARQLAKKQERSRESLELVKVARDAARELVRRLFTPGPPRAPRLLSAEQMSGLPLLADERFSVPQR